MPRGPVQRVQDSVHGLMEFRGMEALTIELLRTPEIQRLRRIRQLGLCHFVFPGAEHSRLVHSLGAAWIAVRFGRQLLDATRGYLIEGFRPDTNAVRDLAVAALCHDLGHGPLSHAWERGVIGEGYDLEMWGKKLGLSEKQIKQFDGAKWHELVTAGLLLWPDGQLCRLLEETESGASERIVQLLRGRYYLQYLPVLLSSDVDVDRADFILRDTRQSGVKYGLYDLDWLISTSTVGKTDRGELVTGFDQRKALRVVGQFLMAREALYETVYYHKTVHSAEGMVGLFLKRLKDVVKEGTRIPEEAMLLPYLRVMRGDALDQRELLALDDFSLMVLIDVIANKQVDITASDLARRILARDLFKLVPCSTQQVDDFLSEPHAYDVLFESIKPFCPGDPRYYLIVDKNVFKMFNSVRAEMSYLIDDHRSAIAIREHHLLSGYDKDTRVTRLFTIASAVDAVDKCIRTKKVG